MRYKLTMLASDMNGRPLPPEHGAPLRRRGETQLGFKQVSGSRAWSSSPTSPTTAAATAATIRITSSSSTANRFCPLALLSALATSADERHRPDYVAWFR